MENHPPPDERSPLIKHAQQEATEDDAKDIEPDRKHRVVIMLLKGAIAVLCLLLLWIFSMIVWPRRLHRCRLCTTNGLLVIRQESSSPAPCSSIYCNKGGRRDYYLGDTTRPNFGARHHANLVLFDDFQSEEQSFELWGRDVSLFGDGNGGFGYYTKENVIVQNGALRITPGLFADLGAVHTAAANNNQTYDAKDVMVGNCTPFPACATFMVPHCTIPDFAGCQRIGTPLVTLNPATSGRVSTRGAFEFTYGRIEARLRLPQGDWLWPAFWLMPSDEQYYGPWPNSGEIDLIEARGNGPEYTMGGQSGGRDVFVTSLHYAGNTWWHTQATARAWEVLGADGCKMQGECDFTTDFFVMGLYWSEKRMYAYVHDLDDDSEHILWDVNASAGFGPDDVPLGCRVPPEGRERDQKERTPVDDGAGPYANATGANAPFDRPFYIIFNVAVGGEQNGCPDPNFWGTNAIWCTERDPSRPEIAASTVFWNAREKWYPTWEAARAEGHDAFAIDWVKVWQ